VAQHIRKPVVGRGNTLLLEGYVQRQVNVKTRLAPTGVPLQAAAVSVANYSPETLAF
jgi:hypothetical protein